MKTSRHWLEKIIAQAGILGYQDQCGLSHFITTPRIPTWMVFSYLTRMHGGRQN
jgi:hypothetical protein